MRPRAPQRPKVSSSRSLVPLEEFAEKVGPAQSRGVSHNLAGLEEQLPMVLSDREC